MSQMTERDLKFLRIALPAAVALACIVMSGIVTILLMSIVAADSGWDALVSSWRIFIVFWLVLSFAIFGIEYPIIKRRYGIK